MSSRQVKHPPDIPSETVGAICMGDEPALHGKF